MNSFIQPCMKLLTRPESNLPDKPHSYIPPLLLSRKSFCVAWLVVFLGYASLVEGGPTDKPLGPWSSRRSINTLTQLADLECMKSSDCIEHPSSSCMFDVHIRPGAAAGADANGWLISDDTPFLCFPLGLPLIFSLYFLFFFFSLFHWHEAYRTRIF